MEFKKGDLCMFAPRKEHFSEQDFVKSYPGIDRELMKVMEVRHDVIVVKCLRKYKKLGLEGKPGILYLLPESLNKVGQKITIEV